ncbi:MAG: DUF1329 domain-containing protein [Wenzhouxiangellaceae bacterium]
MSIQSNQKILKLLGAALFALTLAACGSTPDSDAGDNGTANAEAERAAAARAEAEAERRAAAEEAARAEAEAERRAAEEAARAEAEAERRAAEEAARAEAEAERRAAEEAARAQAEAERQAAAESEASGGVAEAGAQAEAERQAAEEAARAEAERQAAEQAREAEEQAARAEAERRQAAQAEARSSAAGPDAAAAEGVIPRTAENIARLGNDLTPMGSLRAGNADGTIPAWDGGLSREDWPAGYESGDRHPDPFSADRPEFVITGENFREYEDRLSAGQIATFERYPDTYFMRVYQTRRTASFKDRVYEASIDNASTAELVSNGEGVENASVGFPFPLPQNSYELMWNHKLKYKGIGGTRYNNQVAPTTGGAYQLVKLREEILGLYYKPGATIEEINNILLYFFQEVESPARLAGNILLVHETLNQIAQPRQAWIYNPGQRRVRRAPNVAYDNPGTASDGLRTNDMTDMFNGAMDRYNWEVLGKKEMYVPYNSYAAHSGDVTPDDLVMEGHLNPEYMRYELHRVWIVDARLKEGTRHINPRRTYYLDEDSYQILLTDHYDQRGQLWRASEAHSINYYEVPTFWSTLESHMDLLSGRYVAVGLDNQDPVNTFDVELSPSNYTPQALRNRGRR